jgi:hypothetical protein
MTNNTFPPCRTTDLGSYISALVNEPWARDGRHCWRLVCEIQRDLFGRTLPPVLDAAPPGGAGRKIKAALFSEHAERAQWRETADPSDGAIALMRRTAAPAGFYIHAGVYLAIAPGGVLHTDNPHGVVFDSALELKVRGWEPTFFVPL